jgi:hypothetical protein
MISAFPEGYAPISSRVHVVSLRPPGPAFTVHPVIGDLFAWLSAVSLVVTVVWGVVRGLRPKRAREAQS